MMPFENYKKFLTHQKDILPYLKERWKQNQHNQKNPEWHAVPRVHKKLKTKEKHLNGTIILRKFGGRIHREQIKRYDEDREFYWIDYDNGDAGKLTHKQVS